MFVDVVVSTATGHQVAEMRMNRRLYLQNRERKLAQQWERPSDNSNRVLQQARIYIGGYLEGTTDIEMKRLITLSGGQVMFVTAVFLPIAMEIQSGKTGQLSQIAHTS
ncbi:hypothetical protein AX17_001127 [Amanita inopinata Kibby_2008]|nr:hypothetical protein AX17_001127 [Amanita inopinata Kibby_2008]